MFISGCQFYRNKREKKEIFRDLKREFGEGIRIVFGNGLITYTAKVDRTHL